MKRNYFLLGVLVGSIGSVFALQATQKKATASPEKALKRVKDAFSKKYTVTGSWIHLTPQILVREQIETPVYEAGITVKEDDHLKSFTVKLDAASGAVVSIELDH